LPQGGEVDFAHSLCGGLFTISDFMCVALPDVDEEPFPGFARHPLLSPNGNGLIIFSSWGDTGITIEPEFASARNRSSVSSACARTSASLPLRSRPRPYFFS
jgi:hypothetical protein